MSKKIEFTNLSLYFHRSSLSYIQQLNTQTHSQHRPRPARSADASLAKHRFAGLRVHLAPFKLICSMGWFERKNDSEKIHREMVELAACHHVCLYQHFCCSKHHFSSSRKQFLVVSNPHSDETLLKSPSWPKHQPPLFCAFFEDHPDCFDLIWNPTAESIGNKINTLWSCQNSYWKWPIYRFYSGFTQLENGDFP